MQLKDTYSNTFLICLAYSSWPRRMFQRRHLQTTRGFSDQKFRVALQPVSPNHFRHFRRESETLFHRKNKGKIVKINVSINDKSGTGPWIMRINHVRAHFWRNFRVHVTDVFWNITCPDTLTFFFFTKGGIGILHFCAITRSWECYNKMIIWGVENNHHETNMRLA